MKKRYYILIGIAALLTLGAILGGDKDEPITDSIEPPMETPIENQEPIPPQNNQFFSTTKYASLITYSGELKDITPQQVKNTYEEANDDGVSYSTYYKRWGEIELSKDNYDWSNIDDSVRWAADAGVKTAFIVQILDVNQVGKLPLDITFTSFTDPILKERFKDFMLTVLDRHNDIEYVWIGLEVDGYLKDNRDEIPEFQELFEETYDAIKSEHPNVKVGTISTYHDAKTRNELDIIKTLGETGDLIGLTYYPQFLSQDTSKIPEHFEDMSDIASDLNKNFAITESGWSTLGFEGSEAQQLKFMQEILSLQIENIEYIGFYNLHDVPVEYYGLENYNIDVADQYITFLLNLGLKNNDASSKQAWEEFKNK
ncbi:glycosyl hydrolase 53 family protein [Candidatus Pacearchaeota archaeon]|nr:glycosyl hydrolase 53 family protein [Candidatus Pacearchaeota archaeon]